MKRTFAFFLAVIMLLSVSSSAFAEKAGDIVTVELTLTMDNACAFDTFLSHSPELIFVSATSSVGVAGEGGVHHAALSPISSATCIYKFRIADDAKDGKYFVTVDFDFGENCPYDASGTVVNGKGETKYVVVGEPSHEHTVVVDAAVAATCTEAGKTEGSHCSECGEILVAQEVIPALGHKEEVIPAVDATCTETGMTEGKKCTVCGEVTVAPEQTPAIGHQEVVVPAVDATCTEEGKTEGKVCSFCGEVIVEQVATPAIGHNWAVESTDPASCTEDGAEVSVCANCGEKSVKVLPALGHKEEAIPAVEATCTEAGATEGMKCTVCGEVTVAPEEIPALGHKEEAIPAVEATCTEAGATEGKKCTVCGEVLVAPEEIPAEGHEWDDGVVTTEPACMTKGVKTFTCEKCSATQTEEIANIGHLYWYQSSEFDAETLTFVVYYKCEHCDKLYERVV